MQSPAIDPIPRRKSSARPLWSRIIDGGLPVALAATGLLAPDHVGLFYVALLVGFVGLAAPHIARLAAGSSPRVVLPLATLIGALLCVLADVIARSIAPPIELPVGAITAVLGVPLLVSLVTRRVERA